MQPAVLIRLRPSGPWRYGPGDGGQNRVDTLFRSDRLYSAVTLAMRDLGFLEDWLDATARNSTPAVAFSSLLPYQSETLFAPPPATLWPPPFASVSTSSPVFLTKVRWKAAHFVPVSLIESILTGATILADQWIADPESGCLLRRDRPNASPFRVVVRSSAAVDRLTQNSVHVNSCVCAEFESGSGLWSVARFADGQAESRWNDRLKGAFRLLADTGFGARRTSGWGQTEAPEFQQGTWPTLLMPRLGRSSKNGSQPANGNREASLYWLLSLYSPSSAEDIDWAAGAYEPTVRGGRIESNFGFGAGKKAVRMIAEGSVLAARSELIGAAVDVAPDGFAHPVYRSGLALALKLPALDELTLEGPVEVPPGDEFEQRPCPGPAESLFDGNVSREEESPIQEQAGGEEAPSIDESVDRQALDADGQEPGHEI
jgi:CRISPR type III-A-associated RAMP protein Csm4